MNDKETVGTGGLVGQAPEGRRGRGQRPSAPDAGKRERPPNLDGATIRTRGGQTGSRARIQEGTRSGEAGPESPAKRSEPGHVRGVRAPGPAGRDSGAAA